MKHYGWGVVDKDGEAIKELAKEDRSSAVNLSYILAEHNLFKRLAPYKVVELFYSDNE